MLEVILNNYTIIVNLVSFQNFYQEDGEKSTFLLECYNACVVKYRVYCFRTLWPTRVAHTISLCGRICVSSVVFNRNANKNVWSWSKDLSSILVQYI